MQTILFDNKQGGYRTFRSPQGKRLVRLPLVNPPRFSFPLIGTSMQATAPPIEVPYLQEKLHTIKRLIEIDQAAIKRWEAQEPGYYLLPIVREQLSRNKRILAEFGGLIPCQ